MRNFFFFLLLELISLTSTVNAQVMIGNGRNILAKTPQMDSLGMSFIECIYKYSVKDSELEQSKECYCILEVGDDVSSFRNYCGYRIDSVWCQRHKMTYGELSDMTQQYDAYRNSDIIERHINEIRLIFYGNIFIDNYYYEESLPTQDWVLTDSVKDICGYKCNQATCHFRGRDWIVWFCDIPVGGGLWKFSGLPGLVLEARDSHNEHVFYAVGLRNSHHAIKRTHSEYFKTNRGKYSKMLREYSLDPSKIINNSMMPISNKNGEQIKLTRSRKFYNPLEKDWD